MRRNQVKEAYRLFLLAIEACDDLRGFEMPDFEKIKEPTYDHFLAAHNYETRQNLQNKLSGLAAMLKEDLGIDVACSVEDMV